MPITALGLVVPAIVIFTLGFTGLSGYYVYRQNTTLYREVKVLLLYVHIFFGGVMILEFLRNFLTSALFIEIYTILGTSFILWDVLLLMTVGAAVYLRPEGRRDTKTCHGNHKEESSRRHLPCNSGIHPWR